MTHSGKGLRNELRNEQLLLFLAQIVVSCSKNAHARGAVREPRGLPLATVSNSFALAGNPFSWAISGALFFTQNYNFVWKWLPKWSQYEVFGTYIPERVRKQKSVFGLRRRVRIAYEHLPWNAQGNPKIEENTGHISEPCFLIKKSNIYEKKRPKGVRMGDSEKGVAPLGAPLPSFGAPIRFFTPKMNPQCPQSVPKKRKWLPKWCQRSLKVQKNVSKSFKIIDWDT